MRLESSTSSMTILLSCAVLALGACGDDGDPGTTGADGTAGTGSTTDAMTTNVDSTGGGPGGTTMEDPTTGVDGTDSSDGGTTDEPGSTTDEPGTTTGEPGDCPGGGMSFATLTSVDNDMTTNLDVAGLISCNQDITITVTGGQICTLDDGAGGFYYVVETLELDDVPPVTCGLAEIGITNMAIINTGDGMEVVVPAGGGDMAGNQSIQVQGDVEGMALGMPVGPVPLMDFNGSLPEGTADFGADDTTVTYMDDSTEIAFAQPEVGPGISVDVTLTGLNGTVTFAM